MVLGIIHRASPRRLAITALLLRFALIRYAAWHDATYRMRYTDIDYLVVTDGAAHVLHAAVAHSGAGPGVTAASEAWAGAADATAEAAALCGVALGEYWPTVGVAAKKSVVKQSTSAAEAMGSIVRLMSRAAVLATTAASLTVSSAAAIAVSVVTHRTVDCPASGTVAEAAAGCLGGGTPGTGGTPFSRATYRYTPLLAMAMLPNAAVAQWAGKVLLAVCDVLAGLFTLSILSARARRAHAAATGDGAAKRPGSGMGASHADSPAVVRAIGHAKLLVCLCTWFNPIVVQVSTRGNSDILIAFLVLACLSAYAAGRLATAGAALGAAIHVKIYPVIYAPALLVALWVDSGREQWGKTGSPAVPFGRRLARWAAGAATAGVATAASGGLATYYSWWRFGWRYVEEGVLYHVSRVDHRHNLAPYWYPIYLGLAARPVSSGWPELQTPPHGPIGEGIGGGQLVDALGSPPAIGSAVARLAVPALRVVGIAGAATGTETTVPDWTSTTLAFIPQTALLLVVAVALRRDPTHAVTASTVLFVAFNKVVTVQYFVWWLPLLPLLLFDVTASGTVAVSIAAGAKPLLLAPAATPPAQKSSKKAGTARNNSKGAQREAQALRGAATLSYRGVAALAAAASRPWLWPLTLLLAGPFLGGIVLWMAVAKRVEFDGESDIYIPLWGLSVGFMLAQVVVAFCLVRLGVWAQKRSPTAVLVST